MTAPTERRRTAVITGATAGIGAAFARRLAADGYDLLLVARDAARLDATGKDLAARHGGHVESVPADLATEDGCAAVAQRLRDAERPVHLLVNNAGIGLRHSFLRTGLDEEQRLLRLNVGAVLHLTHAALPAMVQRRAGAVINVSSVASFGPVAPGSTYAASKAWVTNFSQSVGQHAIRYDVRVMALCPGFTRTEFQQRAGIDTTGSPSWMWLDPDQVVDVALRDLSRGRMVSIPDWKYKAAVAGLRLTPFGVLTALARRAAVRSGREPGLGASHPGRNG